MIHVTNRRPDVDMTERNVQILNAAIEGIARNVPAAEVARSLGLRRSQFTIVTEAFRVVREGPHLVPEVLAGKLSLYKAHQMIRKGLMIECPICSGAGYVFRKEERVSA